MDDWGKSSINLIKWLKANGAHISDKIFLADLRKENQGRGLVAKEDINEDDELFRIPRCLLMNLQNSKLKDEIPELVTTDQILKNDNQEESDENDENSVDSWVALIIVMMYEESLGKNSKFYDYWKVLPSMKELSSIPIHWPVEKTKSLLKGSDLVDRIGKDEADLQYEKVVLPILEKYKDTILKNVDISLSNFHRMGSILLSYSFDCEVTNNNTNNNNDSDSDSYDEEVPTEKAMVPLADMLNADTNKVNANLFYNSDGTLSMRSTKIIKKDEQIWNTYGEIPNAELLRRYGYVQPNGTQYDVVGISTDMIASFIDLDNNNDNNDNNRMNHISDRIEWIQQFNDDLVYELSYEEIIDIPNTGIIGLPLHVLTELFLTPKHDLSLELNRKSKYPSPKACWKDIKSRAKNPKKDSKYCNLWKDIINVRLNQYGNENERNLILEKAKLVQNNNTLKITSNNLSQDELNSSVLLAGEISILNKVLDNIQTWKSSKKRKL